MFEYEYMSDGYRPIPAGLDAMAPGPELAAVLAGIDVATVSGHDRIVVLRASQRMVSHFQAQVYDAMAAITDAVEELEECSDPMWAPEMAAAEIRAALCLTRRAADSELETALVLRGRLPQVRDALRSGDLDYRRAKTMLYGTTHLPDEAAQTVADTILERAGRLTTGQLAALIRRLAIQVDPDDAHRRYTQATAQRRVVMEPTEAGTANLLGLELAPDRVAAVTRRINRIAQSLKNAGETRTMDQLRADVFVDLLYGRDHRRRETSRGVVDITVGLDTLAGLVDDPGELAGYGSVIADIARQTVDQQHHGEWRFSVTHPESGMPLHVGTTKRRPTASMRRTVEATYRTCIFPGCRMPARGCDLDHRIPWAEGGHTSTECLAPLCRHDHCIRHRGWSYRRLPDGDHLWTSPLNHTYATSGTPP
jgi:hypothetical protein